jgi:phospholipid transport system substrate-binding protein
MATVIGAGAPPAGAQIATPAAAVQGVVEQVLAVLRDDDLAPPERRARLRNALAPHFDFEAMAQSILAQAWKKATPDERQRFIAQLQTLLEDTYIVAMEDYSGETVRVGKEKVKNNRAQVETYIERGGAPAIPVSYRLRARDGKWLAYDVSVEGVSLVSNYRSSFGSIVRKDGIGGLIDALDRKLNSQS